MADKLWGWHLSVNASFCDKSKITDYDTVYNFTKQLVKDIDMEAYGEPAIVHFGHDDKSGFTMTQLISTSNICAHFANDLNAIFLDCFSCKPFEHQVVIDLIKQYFGAEHVSTHFIERKCVI